MERGNTQCLANTAFAFALTGVKPTNFFGAMEKKVKVFAEGANPQEICNALWSIAMLGLAREKEFMLKTIWDRACKTDPKLFNNASMGQLYQVTVHARVDGLMLQPVSSVLRGNMAAAMKALVDVPSKSQVEYSSLLRQIGFRHISEVPALPPEEDAAGFLSIDMADMERKIAIEYDGAPHFLTDLKEDSKQNHGRENGQSTAKRRLLEKMGWKVLNIPFHVNVDMNKISGPGRKAAKVAYLRDLLTSSGVDVPWHSVKGVDHDIGSTDADAHLYGDLGVGDSVGGGGGGQEQFYAPSDPYAEQEQQVSKHFVERGGGEGDKKQHETRAIMMRNS